MSYSDQVLRNEETARLAAQDIEDRKVFSQLCDYYPIASHESNFRVVRDWCGQGGITIAKFQEFLKALESGQADGVTWSLDFSATHEKILADIEKELDPDGTRLSEKDINDLYTRGAKKDPTVIAKSRAITQELAKLKYAQKSFLRARLSELRYRREIRDKSASDLRADLAAYRKETENKGRWHPFPDMPLSMTKDTIRGGTVEQLKMWNRIYGTPQVNARLNGRA